MNDGDYMAEAYKEALSAYQRGECPVGAVLVSLGFVVSARSMAENPHFEGTVRIQHDRDHRVIATGPYAVVRHPGYLGIAVLSLGLPLVLRSSWALVVAIISVLWIVLRTWLEDRTLQAELDGYTEYARRVRSRLIPGVW
jgi:protein-S-isoprenylcysteine O-methyltransferase Ste14